MQKQQNEGLVSDSKKKNAIIPSLFGFQIIGDFGATIAIPVLFFTWIGKKLDAHFTTKPLFLILAFVLAFLVSSITIYRKAKHYGKMFNKI